MKSQTFRGPKQLPDGTTVETHRRISSLFREAVRSLFTLCVSLGIAYSGYELTLSHSVWLRTVLYPALTYLVLNSTWNILDYWTMYFESLQARISEQATWAVDKPLYENCIMLNTSHEDEDEQIPRRVCIIQ